jgi:roadblock/LC7 domain-containing protein
VNAAETVADFPEAIITVRLTGDGQAEEIIGLDPRSHVNTGHFAASMAMITESLVSTWADITRLPLQPVRHWTLRAGRSWLVGTGNRMWVFDESVDIGAVLARMEQQSNAGRD